MAKYETHEHIVCRETCPVFGKRENHAPIHKSIFIDWSTLFAEISRRCFLLFNNVRLFFKLIIFFSLHNRLLI